MTLCNVRSYLSPRIMLLSCDYLGKWEVGSNTGKRLRCCIGEHKDCSVANGKIQTAVDVMRDLLRRGSVSEDLIPRTELEIREDEVVLLDTTDGIKQEVWAYLTSSIVEPVAFVNKSMSSSGISRVVVFTVVGVQGMYDRYNLMFAVQVSHLASWSIVLT